MVAAIIRPTTVLLPDAAARYACTMLQHRGTTLTDLYEARTHLEAAAVETLAGRRSAADLADLLTPIIELHNQSFLCTHSVDETAKADARAAQRAHAKVTDLIRQQATGKAVTFWRHHLHSITEYMISDPSETVLGVTS
jgi:DNA-binding FadR family transcriptional regulator